MSTKTEPRQWFIDVLQQAPALDAAVSKELQHIELPHRKQEAWRYTDLSGLYQQVFKPLIEDAVKPLHFDHWVYDGATAYRLLLVNGQIHFNGSILPQQNGVRLVSRAASDDEQNQHSCLNDSHEFNQDAFDLLNTALDNGGYILQLDANIKLDRPLEIVYYNPPGSAQIINSTRSLILLESGASATVVERFIGSDNEVYFFNGLTRVELKDNAQLMHHRLQNEGNEAYHLHRVHVAQHRFSEYQGLNVATGAGWSRSDTIVNLEGDGAECHLRGLYSLRDRQYNDMHLDVRHLKPHCRSSEQFKGILAGQGRAVFDGRILIEQDAQKSDAQLSNKNLMLVDNAEIDTKPQLEIYADDVKASHGTTVGKIDPAQLFYCRARGINEQQALRMLSLGFAEQVLEDIDDAPVEQAVKKQIEKVLTESE